MIGGSTDTFIGSEGVGLLNMAEFKLSLSTFGIAGSGTRSGVSFL